MNNTIASHWGPKNGIDSRDYVLLMAAETPLRYPFKLLAHTLTSPSQELSDTLTIPFTEIKNGKIRLVQRVKRAAEETGRSYTLGFPSALLTPALEVAMRGGCATRDFFMLYLCPEDEQYAHFIAFPESVMDQPVEANDLITVEDTAIIQQTTTLRTSGREINFHLDLLVAHTVAANAVHALAVQLAECAGCDELPNRNLVYGGGSGTASLGGKTLNQFNSVAAFTFPAGIGATMIMTDVIFVGNAVLASFADKADYTATPATGAVAFSPDGGTTWVVPNNVTDALYAVAYFNGAYYAFGDSGAMWRSENGVKWTDVSVASITSTIGAAAVDEDAGRLYLVGKSGLVLQMTTGDRVVDLTTAVGTTKDLYSVGVFRENWVAVGGADGVFVESVNVGSAPWVAGSVGGSTAKVSGIAGTAYRQIVGAGASVYERSLLTSLEFGPMPVFSGQTITGNVTDVVMGGDANFFAVAYDSGEIAVLKPRHPYA